MIYSPPFTSGRTPKGITPDRVLLYLKAYHLAHDRFPSKSQIAKHFGCLAKNSALHHLRQLIKRGEVKKDGRYFCFVRNPQRP